METETPATTELLDAEPDATDIVAEEPERHPHPSEARIAELTATVKRQEDALAMTQQMQREQAARSQMQGDPKLKEFAEHPYTAFVAQQVQNAVLPLLDQVDRLRAENAITKKYGEEAWDSLNGDLDREHQSYLQRGQWAEREKLAYVVAGQKGIKLEAKADRRATETRTARARGARSAAVETSAPARRADSTPAPPLHTMEKTKRDAALEAHFATLRARGEGV